MALGFLSEMKAVLDHRVAGMVTYPLDEILLATLVSVICGANDWERGEDYACESLDWLRRYLPFAAGVPSAQTFRKVFRLIDPEALQRGGAVGGVPAAVRRGSRRRPSRRHRRQDRARVQNRPRWDGRNPPRLGLRQ